MQHRKPPDPNLPPQEEEEEEEATTWFTTVSRPGKNVHDVNRK